MISIKNWCEDNSEKIINLLKSELNWPFEISQAKGDDSLDLTSLEKFNFHKFNISESTKLLIHFPSVPERVQLLECMDCIIELHGKLWPELLIAASIKRALRRRVKALDLNQAAYVVGEGLEIRPLVMAATELGFSRICIVSIDRDWLEKEKEFLSRRLVGIRFEIVLMTELTLQPQDTNLVLNAFNLNYHKEYLQDLAYFNFMVSGGVVVDLHEGGAHQTLQEEATKAQLTCIKPDEVLLAWWLEMAHKIRPPLSFTKENENNLFQKL
jgi:shikimate 5-dehydrogenase